MYGRARRWKVAAESHHYRVARVNRTARSLHASDRLPDDYYCAIISPLRTAAANVTSFNILKLGRVLGIDLSRVRRWRIRLPGESWTRGKAARERAQLIIPTAATYSRGSVRVYTVVTLWSKRCGAGRDR